MQSLKFFNISAFLKTQMLLLPVLFLFYLDNGLSIGDYFLFQGIIFIVNVLLQIPVGIISNHISRKKLIVLSYFIYLGRVVVWSLFDGYFAVLVGELFYAISKSIFDAVEAPYIYQVLKDKNNSSNMLKAYSNLNVALCLGVGIASILGAVLYKYVGIKFLLLIEFLVINGAIILTKFIPSTEVNLENKYSLEKFRKASKHIFTSKIYMPCILYSGLLAAISHFFFWSFQPILKLACAPAYLFGVIVFANNLIRAISSALSEKISNKIELQTHGLMAFILCVWGFLIFLMYFYAPHRQSLIICITYILFLCVYIGMQLSFTIRQTSFIQHESTDDIRGYVASVNMLVMRAFIGILLMLPKLCESKYGIYVIFVVCSFIIFIFGTILLFKFLKSFKFKTVSKTFVYCTVFVMLFLSIFSINTLYKISTRQKVVFISHSSGADAYMSNSLMKVLLEKYSSGTKKGLLSPIDNMIDYHISLIGNFNKINKYKDKIKSSKYSILWLLYSEFKIDSDGIEKKCTIEEYINKVIELSKQFDAIVVSSKKIFDILNGKIETPLYYIPQFTDVQKFYPDYDNKLKNELLFVGVAHFKRLAPLYAVKNNFPIAVHGSASGQVGVGPGSYIENGILRKYYTSAKINLNDTMPSMREFGFVSNRIYDVAASGGFIISDDIDGLEEIFGDAVPIYRNEKEFVKLVKFYLNNPKAREEKIKKAREITLSEYTNEKAALQFEKVFQDLEK